MPDSIESILARANEIYLAGGHCSEATAIAVCDYYLKPTPEVVKRVSSGFGGGVGGCREELCGVLSGGVIALSAIYGRTDLKDKETDDALKELILAFRNQFIAEFGTSICNPIREAQPEGEKRCGEVVRRGTHLVAQIIADYEARRR